MEESLAKYNRNCHNKFFFVDLRPFLPTFGLIGRPREREADTEKPGQRPTLFRRSSLVLSHAQCIALIQGTSVLSLIRRTGPAGDRTHDPWIKSRAL